MKLPLLFEEFVTQKKHDADASVAAGSAAPIDDDDDDDGLPMTVNDLCLGGSRWGSNYLSGARTPPDPQFYLKRVFIRAMRLPRST